jgi:hypothetical protein
MNDENTGFAAFSLYNALHLHFTSNSYDYFKYNGKTNVSKDSFSRRKDKWHFYRLSRRYGIDDLRDFYVANFIASDIRWVGDISGPEGEDVYKKWQKRIQSLTYNFEQDIIGLFNATESPNEMLMVDKGQHPLLLNEVMHNTITLETLVILNDIMNFFPMWNKKISDDIIWPTYKMKCEKYAPFIQYDKQKFKSILKEAVNDVLV